jgi:hypothetical protein
MIKLKTIEPLKKSQEKKKIKNRRIKLKNIIYINQNRKKIQLK